MVDSPLLAVRIAGGTTPPLRTMIMLCINVALMVVILSFIDRRNGRILFCLRMPQLPHLGAGREQLVKRADRLDPTILQHNDLIGAAQDSAAVGNRQDC